MAYIAPRSLEDSGRVFISEIIVENSTMEDGTMPRPKKNNDTSYSVKRSFQLCVG